MGMPTTVVKEDSFSKAPNGELFREASDMLWRPGEWPLEFVLVANDGWRRTMKRRCARSVEGAKYEFSGFAYSDDPKPGDVMTVAFIIND